VESKEITDSLTSITDYIRWASSEFYRNELTFGHGFANALDEAVYLVLHALNLPYDWPESYFNSQLTLRERERVLSVIMRRIKTRQPAAYVTREAWFCGLAFYVDERVLVPRSPIGELINQHFEPWIDSNRVHRILDLCTGSGCIAIACQYAFPEAEVAASDLSRDALEVATQNLIKHHLSEDLVLYESDLFDQIPPQQFDLIVSNPPYVDAADMAALSEEFKAEPNMGLQAGEDGLEIVDRMLQQAGAYLSDEGLLVVEVGNSQEAMMDKYPELPLAWIDFEHGGSGVFCITAAELKSWSGNQS
jgi:ribosomal protein L3 glutamine methyltransferase